MKQFLRLMIFLMPILLMAGVQKGTLSAILFYNGKPLELNTIKIDAKKTIKTDIDGYAHIRLKTGTHEFEVVGKDDSGNNLGYIKKFIKVIEGKDTQVIVDFTSKNPKIMVDKPLKLSNNDKNETKSKVFGKLNGQILSSQNSKPINGARVFVKGTSFETRSDENGNFSIKIPAKKDVSIAVVHSAFSAQTINNIHVEKDESISKTIKLTPASLELEEFVVLAPKIEGSVSEIINKEKKSDAVGNVLGSEQFSKSGDSSAASALKRVSGITIVGGKYVYVRGLGDRYSTVMYNGLHLPSPEPTKRVVPLDIFPTAIIKSMTIQKAYTADLPGTFGGGSVLIESKDIPKKPFAKLSLGVSASSSVGDDIKYSSDNSKSIPSIVIKKSNGFETFRSKDITKQAIFYRSLTPEDKTLLPGGKIGVSFGDSYKISDETRVGASATFYYKRDEDSVTKNYSKFIYDMNSKKIFNDSNTEANQTKLQNEYGLMFNIGANYTKNHSIKYSYFLVNNISDVTTSALIDYNGATEDRDKRYYEYVEKELSAHQITGSSDFKIPFFKKYGDYLDNLKIDYSLEHATATRDEPGTVETNYLHQTKGINWDQKNWFYYFILNDNVDNYRVDFTLPYKIYQNDNYTKAGFFIYNKSRDFDSRRFSLSDEDASMTKIDLTKDMDSIYKDYKNGDFIFSPAYRDTDSYSATQDVFAFYLKQLYSLNHNLDIVASVRVEDSKQQLSDVKTGKPYEPLETTDVLPALGLTYRFKDDTMQLRASMAQTLSRPDFREFSPNRYKDPITENIVFGNINLKETKITHADIKYEWYPSSDELFSFAIFAKTFDNPIETVVRKNDAQGNELEQSYTNAKSATSYGAELDARKRFGFLGDEWENLLFATNIALIQSNITIDRDSYPYFTKRLTTTDRAMQGQSPYVLNLTLGYDNQDSGNSALFLYNQIGKSISSLGTANNKDIYQQPFKKLDFVTKWQIFKSKKKKLKYYVGFKASNLLDSTMEQTQGDKVTLSYKPGRNFSLKFDVKY